MQRKLQTHMVIRRAQSGHNVLRATQDRNWDNAVAAAFQRSVANAQGAGIRCRCKAAMTMYYAVEQKSNRHEVRGVLSKETGRYGPRDWAQLQPRLVGNSLDMTSRMHESRL
jgi:hypothetical protein